jgi:hypothetical protein
MVAMLASSALGRSAGGEEGAIRARGNCTGASEWRVSMTQDVGIEFELNIETGVPDQDWDITLQYNQHVLLDETVTTDDDGGFEVGIVENNAKGEDKVTIHATNDVTGEFCEGQLQAEL